MHKLVSSKRFDRDLIKILKKNPTLDLKVEKILLILRKDLRHPSLRLHKLSGMGENFSISVDMSVRIIINIHNNEIFLLRIGTHDEVY